MWRKYCHVWAVLVPTRHEGGAVRVAQVGPVRGGRVEGKGAWGGDGGECVVPVGHRLMMGVSLRGGIGIRPVMSERCPGVWQRAERGHGADR